MPALDSLPSIYVGYYDDVDSRGSYTGRVLSGLFSSLSYQVHNYGGLVAIRIALGFCEGGLLPGLVCHVLFLHTPFFPTNP